MERLTIKRPDGWHVEDWKNGIDHHGPAIDRLAAYEDTGMKPEEIKDFVSRWKEAAELAGLCKEAGIDRLRELAEADKDGRITITPVKKELTEKEVSEITGYKCPICKHHEYCTLPMVTPLCGPVYDHFEEAEASETALKAGDHR